MFLCIYWERCKKSIRSDLNSILLEVRIRSLSPRFAILFIRWTKEPYFMQTACLADTGAQPVPLHHEAQLAHKPGDISNPWKKTIQSLMTKTIEISLQVNKVLLFLLLRTEAITYKCPRISHPFYALNWHIMHIIERHRTRNCQEERKLPEGPWIL